MSEQDTRRLLRGASPSQDADATGRVDGPAPLPFHATATLPRGASVGRYIILEQLGQGGMGVVYAAYDPELDRKVAIKLLLSSAVASEGSTGQARLVREAQALARLSHPNVVSVYDVGTWDSGVFVAMELVEGGQTLRAWSKEKPRTWREVVDVFLAAGKGLAAAHAAGLVHRDFKPDNVLLGRDGRVRVLDFGLARQVEQPDSATSSAPVAAEVPRELTGSTEHSHASRSSLSAQLTQVGLVHGTPAFMAPEQFKGQAADARSDQFSFSVALYEALHGERPFGKSPGPGSGWKLTEPPRSTQVPAAVRRIVLKGLSLEPHERFASMEDLLEALSLRVRRRRQQGWVAAGAGLTALAVAVAVPLAVRRPPELCTGAERRLEGVWDAPRNEALASVFAATGARGAANAWQRTAAVLDVYTRGWVSMNTEACEAARIRGEQSDEVLSLRMACLDRRLQSFTALTQVYAQADAALVDEAVKAAHALPLLEGCADVQALRAPVQPPEDAATREKVEALRARFAEVQALFDAGRYKQALPLAEALAADASAVPYKPLQAEVLELHGTLQEKLGQDKEAEANYKRALWAAESGRHDEAAASAASRLLRTGYLQDQYAPAREWAELARAKLERLGGNPRIEGHILTTLGAMLTSEGKVSQGLEHEQRALELREQVYGPEHPSVAGIRANVGFTLSLLERYTEARQELERAEASFVKALGPNYPELSSVLNMLGIVSWATADDEAALGSFQRAFALAEEGLGPEHPVAAEALLGTGTSLTSLGRFDEALAANERALAITVKVQGRESPFVAQALHTQGTTLQGMGQLEAALKLYRSAWAILEVNGMGHPDLQSWNPIHLGSVLQALGRRAEALTAYERALSLVEKTMEQEHSIIAHALEGLGSWHLEAKQPDVALGHFQRAFAIRERMGMPQHPDRVSSLAGIGMSQVALRRPQEALAPLERALKLSGHTRILPAIRADIRFHLAQALWEMQEDRVRALGLAQQARDEYAQAQKPKERVKVERWLAARELTSSR